MRIQTTFKSYKTKLGLVIFNLIHDILHCKSSNIYYSQCKDMMIKSYD